MGDGLDGIGFPFPFVFHTGEEKIGIAFNGQADHPLPVRKGRDADARFMGRHGGGNEDDAVESEQLPHLLGGAEMTDVDRIERSAQEAPFHDLTWPLP